MLVLNIPFDAFTESFAFNCMVFREHTPWLGPGVVCFAGMHSRDIMTPLLGWLTQSSMHAPLIFIFHILHKFKTTTEFVTAELRDAYLIQCPSVSLPVVSVFFDTKLLTHLQNCVTSQRLVGGQQIPNWDLCGGLVLRT